MKRHLNKLSALKGSEETSAEKRLRRSGSITFNFRQHCLFCGEECFDIDPKHPDRWRRVVVCRTAVRGKGVCTSRHDDWAREVETSLGTGTDDLHAADGRYHTDC